MVARPGVNAAVLLLATFAVGCKEHPPPPDAGPKVADHLATNEIPEGRDKAFALVLPLASRVMFRFPDSVEVESELRPEELSNYIRAHVKTDKIAAGAERTTFDQAIVPSDPKRVLHIDVRPGKLSHNVRSSMLIRDITPLPPEPKISDEEAWKRAGRAPDGKPLDPNHVF